MKSTRTYDLGYLEEKRDAGSSKAAKVLEDVHRQSKNEDLERARQALIQAHRKRDVKTSLEIEKAIRNMS